MSYRRRKSLVTVENTWDVVFVAAAAVTYAKIFIRVLNVNVKHLFKS